MKQGISAIILSLVLAISLFQGFAWGDPTLEANEGANLEAASTQLQAMSEPMSGRYSTNINWTLNEEGVLSFSLDASGINAGTPKGSIMFDFWGDALDSSYKTRVKSISIGAGITKIGDFTFKDCSNLRSIELPNSLTTIGWQAFENCSSLQSVTAPLQVKTIGHGAFLNCTALHTVELSGATVIESQAFQGCTSLEAVYLPYVTTIGSYAFGGCSSLSSIDLYSTDLESIQNHAFYNCTSLTSVELPTWVTTIGERAFSGCDSLSAAFFYCDVVSLGDDIFATWRPGAVELTISGYQDSSAEAYATRYGISFRSIGTSSRRGTCDNGNVNWYLDDDGTLTFSGVGDIDEGFGSTRAFPYNYKKVRKVVLEDGIDQICEQAFYGCSNLRSVIFADSVWDIGPYAFQGCTSLTAVDLPCCEGVLPSGMSWSAALRLGEGAFQDCTGLESITIPYNLQAYPIPENAFAGCISLTDAYYRVGWDEEWGLPEMAEGNDCLADATIHYIGLFGFGLVGELTYASPAESDDLNLVITGTGEMFDYEVLLNPDVESSICGYSILGPVWSRSIWWDNQKDNIVSATIEAPITVLPGCESDLLSGIFCGCTNLSSVTLPSSLSEIGAWSFWGCESLTHVDLPSNVTSIGEFAFLSCGITEITIPDGVTVLNSNAFSNSALRSITIPQSVTTINEHVFEGCVSLETVLIPDSVTFIGEQAFFGCKALRSVELPANLRSISDGLFYGCSNLTSIAFPTCEVTIGNYAFCGCAGPELLTIPGNVTSIGEFAFQECGNLKAVALNEGVITIAQGAFYGCDNLERACIPTSVSSIDTSAFIGNQNLTIFGYSKTEAERYAFESEIPFVALDSDSPMLVDVATNVKVAGEVIIEKADVVEGKSVVLNVTEPSDAQLVETAKAIKDSAEANEARFVDVYDVGLDVVDSSGAVVEELTEGFDVVLTLPVGGEYNGCIATVTQVHDGVALPSRSARVVDAAVVLRITSLSQFVIVVENDGASNGPVDFSGITIALSQTAYTYDGKAKTPGVTVKAGDAVVPASCYDVKYDKNVNAGTATVTVTGKDGYAGSKSASFEISPAAITSVSTTTICTYDGAAKKPGVTVKAGSLVVPASGYDVKYSSNVNAGTATVTVTGKGNYTGTKSATFKINPAAITSVSTTAGCAYDGAAKKPGVTVKAGSLAVPASGYTVAYKDNVNAGTATVTVTGKGNYSGAKSATFKITPASLATATVALSKSAYTHDGKAKTPTATVKLGSKTLKAGTDYAVSYSNNVKPGLATATVTGKGNYSGTVRATFSIAAASAPPAPSTPSTPSTPAVSEPDPEPEPVSAHPLYRLFQPKTGEHHYTLSAEERDICTDRWGWTYEGVAWDCPEASATPVYRLFHPTIGLHHYTTSAEERDICTDRWGWTYEGVAWYADDGDSGAPVYRLFHPVTAHHHYTTSWDEVGICTDRWGWTYEGVAWYARE